MNWTSLGVDIAKLGAPMLASVFLGPEAGPLVGALVGKLATALNVDPTPEAVQTALKADPDAQAKVQVVEAQHADIITAYLADVANARATNVQLVQSGSLIAWGPVVISAIITLGFFGLLTIMLVLKLDGTNPVVIAILNVLLGTLAASFTQVCNYWLGSTKGSSDKTNAVVTLANNAIAGSKPRR